MGKLTLINSTDVLIDKICISNLEVTEIRDQEKLKKLGLIHYSSPHCMYHTDGGQSFSSICIQDDIVNKFHAGIMIQNALPLRFCNLEMCIPGGNLNCYNYSQYKSYFLSQLIYLQDEYGILLDASDATIKHIELNKTFESKAPFKEYYRIFNVFSSLLPKSYRKNSSYKEWNASESWYAKTTRPDKYFQIKFYNKSKQIEDTTSFKLDFNCMRAELTVHGTEYVNTSLGTNRLFDLNDDILSSAYYKKMNQVIVNKTSNWNDNRPNSLSDIVLTYMSERKHWISELLPDLQTHESKQGCPILLDISELFPILDDIVNTASGRYKIRTALRQRAKNHEHIFCSRDDLKLQEILHHITSTSMSN